MKYILLLAAAILFSACSSHSKHDHAGHDHANHNHADHKHEGGEACASCSGHKDATGHEEKCADCAHKEHAAAAATEAAWGLAGNPQLKTEISKEAFQTAYEKKKETLGKVCVNAAMEYCGKTTKDLAVTESEVQCLWAKSQRVTRESLPKLDKTKCDKTLKTLTK